MNNVIFDINITKEYLENESIIYDYLVLLDYKNLFYLNDNDIYLIKNLLIEQDQTINISLTYYCVKIISKLIEKKIYKL